MKRVKEREKMATYLSILAAHSMGWLAMAGGAFYAGVVVVRYRTDGPYCRLSFDPVYPVRSAEQLVVWIGVKVLEAGLKLAKAMLSMLLEASAEVGEWAIRRNPSIRENVRSRFLV